MTSSALRIGLCIGARLHRRAGLVRCRALERARFCPAGPLYGPGFAITIPGMTSETRPAPCGKFGIGARLLRKEDARHLRGRACFVADVPLPGILQVAFVRSPVAHARLTGVTVTDGLKGRWFTPADLPLEPVRSVPNAPA